VQELGEEYRTKTNKELLRLALTPEQLTPEAQSALTAELATRDINGEANLDAARHEEEQRKAENDRAWNTWVRFRSWPYAVWESESCLRSRNRY
jgi:hypothetical protein